MSRSEQVCVSEIVSASAMVSAVTTPESPSEQSR